MEFCNQVAVAMFPKVGGGSLLWLEAFWHVFDKYLSNLEVIWIFELRHPTYFPAAVRFRYDSDIDLCSKALILTIVMRKFIQET